MIIDKEKSLTLNEKKSYVKLIRTQLSTPEIGIIFLNSISHLGRAWSDNKLVEKYEIIKNLPKNYFECVNPERFYPKLNFEYKEFDNFIQNNFIKH
jgi:hypothetical protein